MTTKTESTTEDAIANPDEAEEHCEGDEPVEMWAVSRQLGRHDATKLDDFWVASPKARQYAG